MPISQYLESTLVLFFVSILFFGVSFRFVFHRLFGVSRVVILLSILGVTQVLLVYFQSFGFVIALILLQVISTVFSSVWKGNRESLWEPIKGRCSAAFVLVVFTLFIFRWEPLGFHSIGWASEAKRLSHHLAVSFFSRHTISLGGPLIASTFSLVNGSMERVASFLSCIGFLIFGFSLSQVGSAFLDRKAATMGSLVAAMVTPVAFRNWVGGNGIELIGFSGGLCLLEWQKLHAIRKLSLKENIVFGFSFVAAYFFSPVAFASSLVILIPFYLWIGLRIVPWKLLKSSFLVVAPIFALGGAAAGVQVPRLFAWGERTHFDELTGVGVAALVSLAYVTLRFGRAKFLLPVLLSLGGIVGLSFFYPTVEALLSIPFSLVIGALLVRLDEERKKLRRKELAGLILVFLLIALGRVGLDLFPHLGKSLIQDREWQAMRYLEKNVPIEDCIGILRGRVGEWIPVVSGRCVVDGARGGVAWQFVGSTERRGPGQPVFDNGAAVYLRDLERTP